MKLVPSQEEAGQSREKPAQEKGRITFSRGTAEL